MPNLVDDAKQILIEQRETQSQRISRIANTDVSGNIFLDPAHIKKIIAFLLKQKRLDARIAAELSRIDTLSEFKQELSNHNIILDWTGNKKDTPKFTYPKDKLIGSASEINTALKGMNTKNIRISKQKTVKLRASEMIDGSDLKGFRK